MFLSLQDKILNADNIAYIQRDDSESAWNHTDGKGYAIAVFFAGDDLDDAPFRFRYATERERDAVYAKLRELLDVQPVETHLEIDREAAGESVPAPEDYADRIPDFLKS